mmetsp:Transcript_56423/g.150937  ORF Transcript_56423/g.150937 Transcript_56423/m.150937 type:complete len:232 (-) Transcript_56423:30-725(-)
MALATYVVETGEVPVGVLKLDDGKANAFGFQMLAEVNRLLDRAETDETKSLVVLGNAKIFSAGFDLQVMRGEPGKAAELVDIGGRLVLRIFGFPKPVIMALTGHGLALGSILLLAGDVRLGQRGSKAKVGLTEVSIGMVVPAFGWRLAKYRLKNSEFTRAVTQGTGYDVEGAAAVGYLDEVVEGDVVSAAMAEARRLGAHVKQPAFAQMKRMERIEVIEAVLSTLKQGSKL